MDPKVKDKTGGKKKPKKMISMEAKHEIIAKHERGVRIIDLANEYGRNPSTISTIIKKKGAIKKLQPSKGVTIVSKLRTNIHDEMEQLLLLWIKEKQLAVIRHGEASSGDIKATENFIKVFEKLISEEGYLPQQVFNCDETGLFWKKMSRRMFITAEVKSLPGHKAMKDRLTLALCANAIGDFKIKPLLV
ncbi:HTH CENPB-type domain-containing protein [Nephila pilipes]|uniref:HTH CENPB-type domain-containing protein n=1 Tax=Nephila pilipes TaxID=299642 RepID=A0A8X6P371_NEPPI|nr:HTH CENPB-type domain-containing protein [Nephila pilipes]